MQLNPYIRRSFVLLAAVAILAAILWAAVVPKPIVAPPLTFKGVQARVFESALTGNLTATIVGMAVMLEEDTLLRIEGNAKTIRAVRRPVDPKSEEDFKQLLPLKLSELTAEPFTVRLTELGKDFPQQGWFELTFIFEKAGDIVYRLRITTLDELRATLPSQVPPN